MDSEEEPVYVPPVKSRVTKVGPTIDYEKFKSMVFHYLAIAGMLASMIGSFLLDEGPSRLGRPSLPSRWRNRDYLLGCLCCCGSENDVKLDSRMFGRHESWLKRA